MIANDDFYGKELNLNCFYMHTIFGQKYPKTAIVLVVKFHFLLPALFFNLLPSNFHSCCVPEKEQNLLDILKLTFYIAVFLQTYDHDKGI